MKADFSIYLNLEHIFKLVYIKINIFKVTILDIKISEWILFSLSASRPYFLLSSFLTSWVNTAPV